MRSRPQRFHRLGQSLPHFRQAFAPRRLLGELLVRDLVDALDRPGPHPVHALSAQILEPLSWRPAATNEPKSSSICSTTPRLSPNSASASTSLDGPRRRQRAETRRKGHQRPVLS